MKPIGQLVILALLTISCRGGHPSQPPHHTPPLAAEMARDQIFFAAQSPEPLLLALIVQRTREPDRPGAVLEAKALVAARNRLQSLFWERISLDSWPGEQLQDALQAWQSQRSGRGLRLSFQATTSHLSVAVRQPEGGFELEVPSLTEAGTTQDPHGLTRLRSGAATLTVNGQTWQGVVLAEALEPGSRAWPNYGQFEMWLATTARGGLWLGRCDLSAAAACGEAIHAKAGQPLVKQPFSTHIAASRQDAASGFALPTAWSVDLGGPLGLERQDGQLGRGKAPAGGSALYDLSVATGGGALALVFHLQDR